MRFLVSGLVMTAEIPEILFSTKSLVYMSKGKQQLNVHFPHDTSF
jgi:hypothetical protein